MPSDNPADAQSVLTFWFGDGLDLGWPSDNRNGLWWGGGKALDDQINASFGDRVRQAVAGDLSDWEALPLTRLALVILLDQFTRNVFRGTNKAFAGDTRAQALVTEAIDRRLDLQLAWVGRAFFYMPLMHAENIALQNMAVARFSRLQDEAPESFKERLKGNVTSAVEHRDIIARFGRFPYRNAVLGRANTPAEDDFVKHGPRFGQ